jgi:EsV-1-7 cysteine-rich motif
MPRKCSHSGCGKRPGHGLELGKPTHCKTHASEDMVDVVNKRCSHSGCGKHPYHGLELGKPTHCKTHASEDMVDVLSRRCSHSGCGKQPKHGLELGKPTHCKTHASEDMVDVMNRRCSHSGCGKHPRHGLELGKPTHCKTHASDDMVDVKNIRCIEENCDTFVSNKRYAGRCLRCHVYLCPEQPVARAYKIKEKHVTDYISERHRSEPMLLGFPLIIDKIVNGGCSRRRPDVLLDVITHSIIVEVDENGHNTESYCECENKRLMILFEDLGSRPMIVIRFNPDGYTDKDGKKHSSCFQRHKSLDVPIIAKNRGMRYLEERLELLWDRVIEAVRRVPDRELTVEHLFFDGFV